MHGTIDAERPEISRAESAISFCSCLLVACALRLRSEQPEQVTR